MRGLLAVLCLAAMLAASGCDNTAQAPADAPPSADPVLPPTAGVQSLSVSPAQAVLPQGETQTFTVTATLSDGSEQDLTGAVTWSVRGDPIGELSPAGAITAIASGSAVLTARYDLAGLDATALISVPSASLVSLQLSADVQTLAAGLPLQLKAEGQLSNGTQVDLTNLVTWQASQGGIVALASDGRLLGLAAGSVLITAVDPATGVHGQISIQVTSALLQSIEIVAERLLLPLGLHLPLRAIGHFSDGTTLDVTSVVNWASADGLLARVSPGGLLTALGLGNVQVTATDPAGGVQGAATVRVVPALLQWLELSPDTSSLLLGLLQSLTAIGHYSDGSTANLTGSVQWSSDNPLIATVNGAGSLLGLSLGQTLVHAVDPDSGQSASGAVSVLPLPIAGLVNLLLSAESLTVPVGLPLQLSAVGVLSDGSRMDLTDRVTWQVGQSGIVALGAAGQLLGLDTGSALITAVDSATGLQSQITIQVTPAVLQTLAILAGSNPLPLGLGEALQAIGHFSDGSTQDLTSTAQWSSSDSAVAGVSGGGALTALGLGSATVSATDPSSGVQGTLPVQIVPAVLQSLEVSPSSLSLLLGLVKPLSATGHFSDGSSLDLTHSVAWSSDNALIASVSSGGSVLALALGQTAVRAVEPTSGQSTSASISVLSGLGGLLP